MRPALLKQHVKQLLSRTGVLDPGAKWGIGIYEGPSPLQLAQPAGIANPVLTWRSVTDVPASLVADPFMVRSSSGWQMFFEVMNAATKRGEIALAVSEDGLSWEYEQIVLAEPFHLSYPYVFHTDGQHYMLPESHEDGAVHLYRAQQYPHVWAREATLVTGHSYSDPSVVCVRGHWYLFVETSPSGSSDTLRLYHADRLLGPWREHPESPVLTRDPYGARPAGRIVVERGRLLRFAQTCYPSYGRSVRAFEITDLSPTTYSERSVSSTPVLEASGQGWNGRGMHHVDAHEVTPGLWRACVDGYSETSLRVPWRRRPAAPSEPPQLELLPPVDAVDREEIGAVDEPVLHDEAV